MIFSHLPLETMLSNVLTLGKLRPKEEVMARVHWSRPGLEAGHPGPQPGPGRCLPPPETSLQPRMLPGHTVHGREEVLLGPDSCSVLLFLFSRLIYSIP